MNNPFDIGVFRGTTLIQKRGSVGGARSVFVKLKGVKNELVYPTFGAILNNPFKSVPAKMYAGDLMEFRLDANGVNPKLFLLKTFKVAAQVQTSATVTLYRDGYKHVPCVGDSIGLAPAEIGGAMTELTIVKVVANKDEHGKDIWTLTMSETTSLEKDAILVEGDGEGNMLVKKINAFADSDADFLEAPATSGDDFDGARYMYTPAIGNAYIYTNKMVPLPKCVLDTNISQYNGWFRVNGVS